MHHELTLITTITASLGLALILGMVAVRLRLPPLVGYLLAGVAIGPATPGLVADVGLAGQLAEIGVMLLMFGVGLHFSIEDLLAVRRIAVPGALGQILAATLLTAGLGWFWGWNFGQGIVFGIALSVASTVVLLRNLEQLGMVRTVDGRIAVGWLVVEDLVTVLVLVLLPPVAAAFSGGVGGGALVSTLGATLGKIVLFVVLMLVLGKRVLPWLLWQVAGTRSRELFTLCVMAFALGIAYGAMILFGVSVALGAFFAGMAMRESPLSHRAAEESLPFRDAFSVLFFVSVGMLFDPRVLVDSPLMVLSVLGVILLGKSFVAFAIVIGFRYPLKTALTVAASLAQVGEFSFILADLAGRLELMPDGSRNLLLAGAILSIAINPWLLRTTTGLEDRIRAMPRLARMLDRSRDPLAALPSSVTPRMVTGHILVVGCGKLGESVVLSLEARGVSVVVVDHNRERVLSLRDRGTHAVAGEADDPLTLVQAHVARASVVLVAISDASKVRTVIDTARTLNPQTKVYAGAGSREEADLLRKDGIDAALDPETGVSEGLVRLAIEASSQHPS